MTEPLGAVLAVSRAAHIVAPPEMPVRRPSLAASALAVVTAASATAFFCLRRREGRGLGGLGAGKDGAGGKKGAGGKGGRGGIYERQQMHPAASFHFSSSGELIEAAGGPTLKRNSFLNPILGHFRAMGGGGAAGGAADLGRTLSVSLQELNPNLSTASLEYSPTSALSVFKNPFTVIPQSPKLDLPNIFADSAGDLFEVINPDDVRPLRFIGSGAFGSVYEAILAEHGKVAVKLVNISHSHASKGRLESFKREVDVLSRVNHNNVVKLHGACMCPPNVFIVMELLEGSLRDKVRKRGSKAGTGLVPRRHVVIPFSSFSQSLSLSLSPSLALILLEVAPED